MILFTIIVISIIALAIFIAASAVVGIATALVVFGDVIICAAIIIFIIRMLFRR